MVEIDSLLLQLWIGCSKCKRWPLNITETSYENNCSVNLLEIICDKCNCKSIITLHSNEVEEEMVLGCIHTGLGHSHLEALLCMAEGKFKVIERKVGAAVESIARERCERWREQEKKVEIETCGNSGLKGAFDASWSKRGGSYNALSGRGTVIRVNAGKFIDFGIKNKNFRISSAKNHHSMIAGKISRGEPRQWNQLYVKTSSKKILQSSGCWRRQFIKSKTKKLWQSSYWKLDRRAIFSGR